MMLLRALVTSATIALCASPALAQVRATVPVASIIDLDGQFRDVGRSLRRGLNVALRGAQGPGNLPLRAHYRSDGSDWQRTVEALRLLVEFEPIALIANTGSVTTEAALPLLETLELPLVAPYSGAAFLREPGVPVVNLRPSYRDETRAAVLAAHAAGFGPETVCAIAGEVSVGAGVVAGLASVVEELAPGSVSAVALAAVATGVESGMWLDELGVVSPVAPHAEARTEFASSLDRLDEWQAASGVRCQLLLFTGKPEQAARLANYLRYRGEDMVLVLLSRAHSQYLASSLQLANAADRVVLARVMPVEDTDIPVVWAAREALGSDFGPVSLEGYLAGRLFKLMIERLGEQGGGVDALLATVLGREVDLDGLLLDFRNDNQGLDAVTFTHLSPVGWQPVTESIWRQWR